MSTLKAFKFRLEPTTEQSVLLNKTVGCCRFVWNKMVTNFNSWNPETPPEKVTSKTLKDNPEFSWLKDVSAAALQQTQRNFEETKKQFFNKNRKKKIGRPKKKKKGRNDSYRLPNQKFSYDTTNHKIRLEKIGFIDVIADRELPEDVEYRSVTISKTPSGKWFVSILTRVVIEPKPLTGQMVGIDLGIKDIYILSDGQVVENPKWYHENQVVLKKDQQRLSRKVKESKRYEKQRIKVAKVHEKIKNKRNYFLHNISSSLVTNYDLICLEDLNVSGMVKNHCLAKAIQNASWSSFVAMLAYKCDWYGKTLVKVDRFFPSSKTCSSCGFKMEKMGLKIREWVCPSCGSRHHRDHNAAKNILQEGFRILSGQEFAGFPKPASAECVEYRRGEAVSLFDAQHHLASFVKRLEELLD